MTARRYLRWDLLPYDWNGLLITQHALGIGEWLLCHIGLSVWMEPGVWTLARYEGVVMMRVRLVWYEVKLAGVENILSIILWIYFRYEISSRLHGFLFVCLCFVCLLEFYILTTFKVISGGVLAYDRGDLIVLPHLETRPPALLCHIPLSHIILTLS